MKNTLKKYLLLGIFTLSLVIAHPFRTTLVHADVLPEGKKNVPVCAVLMGIDQLPKLTIFARETGPVLQSSKVWIVKNNDCIDVSYKFNTLELYAVDASYGATILEKQPTYDPVNDPKAYKANLQVDVKDQLVDLSSKLEYVHNEYSVAGVDNQKHQLVLVFVDSKSNLMIGDAFPTIPTGLDDHIQNSTSIFSDVAMGSTYYDALSYLKSLGVVCGYADGRYRSGAHINRAEFTKIVVEATRTTADNGLCMEGFANADGSYKNLFTDVLAPQGNEQPLWYLNYICYAKTEHLINGYADGSFKPNDEINFAEAAKILANAFQLGADFPANQVWYKIYVDVLAYQKAIPTTIKQFNQKITRGEMAEMVYRLKAGKTNLASQSYATLQ